MNKKLIKKRKKGTLRNVYIMEVNGHKNYLVTNILQNVFFYVTEKKES